MLTSSQTKGKSLEQINLLFSGPKILLDLPMDELERMQQEEIDTVIAEDRIKLGGSKMTADTVHIERV